MASANNTIPTLPNPLTPLAWLPPDIANQLENARYILAAVVGAWIWDFLMSLPEEFRMFIKLRFTIADFVYILSRLSSFAFILQSLLFIAGPVNDCQRLVTSIGWCFALAMPLNSLLFFFRVRAVFNQSRGVVMFFAFLWLCTLSCFSDPFAIQGAVHVGTTSICVETSVKSFSSAGIVIVSVHDTLVYLAISLQLTLDNLEYTSPSFKDYVKVFFSGRGMGQISKALLTSGQLYYLATVGLNIISIAIIFSPTIPAVYKSTPAIPNIALQNAMACRVHRHLKLGLITENTFPSFYFSDSPPHPNTRKTAITSLQFRCQSCQSTTVETATFRSTTAGREHELVGRPEAVKIEGRSAVSVRGGEEERRGDVEMAR